MKMEGRTFAGVISTSFTLNAVKSMSPSDRYVWRGTDPQASTCGMKKIKKNSLLTRKPKDNEAKFWSSFLIRPQKIGEEGPAVILSKATSTGPKTVQINYKYLTMETHVIIIVQKGLIIHVEWSPSIINYQEGISPSLLFYTMSLWVLSLRIFKYLEVDTGDCYRRVMSFTRNSNMQNQVII